MARLQVLDLPATPDDPAPFALVLDGFDRPLTVQEIDRMGAVWTAAAKAVGARGVLIHPTRLDVEQPPARVEYADAALLRSEPTDGNEPSPAFFDGIMERLRPVLRNALNDVVIGEIARRSTCAGSDGN